MRPRNCRMRETMSRLWIQESDQGQAAVKANHPPLPLGTVVKPWGKIAAVQWLGERYYFLVSKRGSVSMMPADLVERKTVMVTKMVDEVAPDEHDEFLAREFGI